MQGLLLSLWLYVSSSEQNVNTKGLNLDQTLSRYWSAAKGHYPSSTVVTAEVAKSALRQLSCHPLLTRRSQLSNALYLSLSKIACPCVSPGSFPPSESWPALAYFRLYSAMNASRMLLSPCASEASHLAWMAPQAGGRWRYGWFSPVSWVVVLLVSTHTGSERRLRFGRCFHWHPSNVIVNLKQR
jgi:hypothetical protein